MPVGKCELTIIIIAHKLLVLSIFGSQHKNLFLKLN